MDILGMFKKSDQRTSRNARDKRQKRHASPPPEGNNQPEFARNKRQNYPSSKFSDVQRTLLKNIWE